ncbi:MAG: hypothetical protein WCA04_15685 [Geobacteraceae bacterium]
MLYLKSPLQQAHKLKDSFEWGGFIRYIEIGEDGFAFRQVDEYENGYLTRYDRNHWEDRFGTLADFRYGETWRKHWRESDFIEAAQFEQKWIQAGTSPPFATRQPSPSSSPPWITLFESGKWSGQA